MLDFVLRNIHWIGVSVAVAAFCIFLLPRIEWTNKK